MPNIKHHLSKDNQLRLLAAQVSMQEVFNLPKKPDEETTLALSLMLWNVSLDLLSKGKINLIFTNPKKKSSARFNFFRFFKENFKTLKEKNRKEKWLHEIN